MPSNVSGDNSQSTYFQGNFLQSLQEVFHVLFVVTVCIDVVHTHVMKGIIISQQR